MPDQNAGVAGSSGIEGEAALGPGRQATAVGAAQRGSTSGNDGKDTASRTESRWSLRNWRLRNKLVAVLIVPTLTALVLGGLRVKEDLDRATEFRQTVSQVDLAGSLTSVIQELQEERTITVGWVASNRPPARADMDAQRTRVDDSINALRDAASKVQTTDNAARERYTQGLQRLSALQYLRSAVDTSGYPDIAVYAAYDSILERLVQLGREVNSAVTDQDLLRRATTIQALSEAKEFATRENAALQIAAARDSFPSGLLDQARAADASFSAAITSFLASATPEEQQTYSDTFSGPEVDDRERIRASAFNRAGLNQPLAIDGAQLAQDGTDAANRLRQVETELIAGLRDQANSLADSATTAAISSGAIVVLDLLLALVLMLVVTRSLLKPLRVLRTNALDVAYTRLPETVQRILAAPDPIGASRNAVDPVPVFTREETGEVARSFDAVHEQAVRMAAEQALLRDNVNSIFVNLSRRSQALVERQLNLIDRLEQDEQDPDQLASLFELDHLATRMRRNSESLLVLSGTGLSRQLTRPVPAADVVGAAISEVEQYARIEVVTAPEVTVQGRAVNDLVHLVAELLDNATSFSEPEKKVTVRMTTTRKRELAIQITDFGVGMAPAEIESANQRLADPPDLDVSVTRRMGLYVVARLAQRHDIQVRLRDNEDIEGGLIARIIVPAALIQASRSTSTTMVPNGHAPATPDVGRPSARAGGIAGAFTGNMPRLRDMEPFSEPSTERSFAGSGTGSFSAFQQNNGNGSHPPVDDAPESRPLWTSAEESVEAPAAFDEPAFDEPGSLFLDPFADAAPASSYAAGDNDSEYGDSEYEASAGSFDPSTAYVPPAVSQPDEAVHHVDAPTERLPIYEAVLSQWFESGDADSRIPVAEEILISEDGMASVGSATVDPHETFAGSISDEQDSDDEAGSEAPSMPEPAQDSGSNWQSPGDDGWQAAEALLTSTPDIVTTSGLPKRVPKAQLVPGSASSQPESSQQQTQRAPLPPRSADAVRGRMSSFQQGVQRGRHALIDAYAGDQSNTVDSRQNEEQE